MKPGRELDALVAEKVMGYQIAKALVPAIFVEGEWSIRADYPDDGVGPDSGWMCYSGLEPAYVRDCQCDQEPIDWFREVDMSDPRAVGFAQRHADRDRAEREREIPRYGHLGSCLEVVPRYSTDISSAWEIMELVFEGRMTKHPRVLPSFSVIPIRDDVRTWMTAAPEGARFAVTIEEGGFFAYGETVPHAICLAALRAFGVSEGTPQPHETR